MENVVEEELMDEVDETEAESPQEDEDTFTLPDKFQNKSAEEIAKSYTELEKELGRKNNEVGELRKLTDQYIHQELARRTVDDPKESEPSIGFDELVDDPDKVLGSVVDRKLKRVDERFERYEAQIRAEKFMQNNPDYLEIGQSQEFLNWANASPYRARQFNLANAGDFDAAEDLLGIYRDQVKSLQKAAKQGEKVKRDKALSDATVETAGSGETSGKTFKRADLMKLRMQDPEKYWAMADEIQKAYAEGRVR
jgi:hypothetical protein